MSTPLSRNDTSLIGKWWWTVDRRLLCLLCSLMAIGAIMIAAASPAVASRIGLSPNYFVKQHLLLLLPSACLMLATSLLSPLYIRRLAVLALIGVFACLVATPFMGTAIKGAVRWISIGGFSLQASEFLKPALAVGCAWMFAEWRKHNGFPGWLFAMLFYAASVTLLMMQPDFGQTAVVSAIWWTQFFLAGMPIYLVIIGLPALGIGAVGIYYMFPHVHSRVNRFLDPESGDTYQIDQSIRALHNGGFLGRGPGEGQIKHYLPDAHADFIFSIIGEEFGLIACMLLVCLIIAIFWQVLKHVMQEKNLFVVLATMGLLTQFMVQSFINIASSLNMIPTKGMTLPFISYGGSSLIATAWAMGMLLALTRSRAGSRIKG